MPCKANAIRVDCLGAIASFPRKGIFCVGIILCKGFRRFLTPTTGLGFIFGISFGLCSREQPLNIVIISPRVCNRLIPVPEF